MNSAPPGFAGGKTRVPVLKNYDGSNWFAEAPDWESSDPHAVRKIGLSKASIQLRMDKGLSWGLGQLYGVLATGLISAEHIFEGLRRPMSVAGDGSADQTKLVFTWVAHRDAQLTKAGQLIVHAAPLDSVFFVIVSPNKAPERYPEIYGWAERWGWLQAHPQLRGAPIAYESRYDRRVWSR